MDRFLVITLADAMLDTTDYLERLKTPTRRMTTFSRSLKLTKPQPAVRPALKRLLTLYLQFHI